MDSFFNTLDDGLSGDGFDNAVRVLALQPDGNMIVGGDFLSLNGVPLSYLSRLKPDGSVDEDFLLGTGLNGKVYSVFLMPDGKILVGGSFTSFNGHSANRLVRLNADGSYDASFNSSTGSPTGIIYDIAVQSDGKIVIVGSFTKYNNVTVNRIARIFPDGTLDTSFSTGVGSSLNITSVKALSDGKLIIGGNFSSFSGSAANRIARLNSNGTIDVSFNTGSAFNDDVNAIEIQTDGKIVVGGNFTEFNGSNANRIIRLNSDGTRDSAFNTTGSGFSKEGVQILKIDSEGNIMAGGSFTGFYNGADVNRVVLLNPNGDINTDFDIGSGPASAQVLALAFDDEKSWFIGGSFSIFDGENQGRLAKVDSEGVHDISYLAAGVGFDNSVFDIQALENNKIIAAGSFKKFNGNPSSRIACLLEDGTLDPDFNKNSNGADNLIKALIKQTDGKIIAAGNFLKYNDTGSSRIVRILSDGSIDASFNIGKGFNNQVYCLALQSDDKIIAAGNFASYNGIAAGKIVRILPNGSRDTSFNPGSGADGIIQSVIVQPDGKILVGGNFSNFNGIEHPRLVRLNSDGSIDSSFTIGFGFDKYIYAMALQPDGKIVIGGNFLTFNLISQKRILRLNSDGSLDNSFNSGAGFSKGDVRSIFVQPDNRILIGGSFSGTYKNSPSLRLIRVMQDGNFDPSFSVSLNNTLYSMRVSADYRLVIGGNFNSVSGISKHRIAKLKLCLDSTVWDGNNWSNGFPSGGKEVVFKESFPNLTSANVCSCTIEGQKTVTLLSGNTLGIEFSYTGLGTLVLENSASLYQSDDEMVNTGIIHLKRKTQPVLKFDFTYWSSPVDHQKLIDFSPNTLVDKYYSYNDVLEKWKIELPESFMTVGKGYLIRAPQNYSSTQRSVFEGVFKGVPNNGKVEIKFEKADSFCLVGNPYPSAVDAALFLKKNTSKTKGALYFWTHNTPITNNNYSADDYAVYNLLGGTATRPALSSGINDSEPDGTIATGQSFFIQSNTSGTIEFNNSMRISGRNSSFFKPFKKEINTNTDEKHRAWINLENSDGVFKQILVGYTPDASNSFDLMYDAEDMNANAAADFYSLADQKKLVIQGRAMETAENDIIVLGFSTVLKGNFNLKLDHQDGFFNEADLYLEDRDLKITHNLSNGPYNFNSEVGTFNERFILKFKKELLNTPDYLANNAELFVGVKKNTITIESQNQVIRKVTIYDVSGNQLYATTVLKNKIHIDDLRTNHQVLFLRILLNDDTVQTKKIIF
ncbi:calcium-binding protein [Flavobacterium foetidum]|uniref:calcium-binding protein n=1 Tax=Flavobacterium foetidum TaxID=2026681 RepID=UPI0010755794|nr:calcium-binding protein [Flavobacterium foetidum]KAF2514542.1 calcium-binding protein [Flavobacterium foetidum]